MSSSDAKDITDITQEKGSEFDIKLKANPQNGYLWKVNEFVDVEGSSILVFVKETTEPLPKYSGCYQHFYFKGDNVGKSRIHMVYKRSWEDSFYDEKFIDVNIS